MKKKHLIVFDIDDTLTKSEYQHQKAYVKTMNQMGICEINDQWETYQHVTDSYILKEHYEACFKKKFDFSLIPEFEKKMTKAMLELPETKAIVGAKEAVRFFLRDTDYAICFATGSLLALALLKLEQAGIYCIPDLLETSNTIYTRENIVKSAIEKAKNYFQVTTFENIISVGDGVWYVKTAKNLGIYFLGIGDKNLKEFQQLGIKSHIQDWSDFDFEGVKVELGIN